MMKWNEAGFVCRVGKSEGAYIFCDIRLEGLRKLGGLENTRSTFFY